MDIKTLLIFVFNVLLAQSTMAQESDHFSRYGIFLEHECESIYSSGLKIHGVNYVFANNVNLRSDSTKNGKILEVLKQGDQIEILYTTVNYAYKIRGHGEPWIKIKTKKGNVGYVYGAMIAKNYLRYDFNENGIEEIILLGSDFGNPPNGKLKIIENGKLLIKEQIDSICIDRHCETLVMLRILKDEYFANREILEIGTGANFCRPVWTSHYYYYHENKIQKVFVEKMGGQRKTTVVFPSDKGGRKNRIIVKKEVNELNLFGRICGFEKIYTLERAEILGPEYKSDLKTNLVELNLNVGDTIKAELFYRNKKENTLISSNDLKKVINSDNGLLKIAETDDLYLLGKYEDEEGEVVRIDMFVLRKSDFAIMNIKRAVKKTAWEHGYVNMYSIYKGNWEFETVKLSGARDFGDYRTWERDTVRTNYRLEH